MALTITPKGTPHFETDTLRDLYRFYCQHPNASMREAAIAVGIGDAGGVPSVMIKYHGQLLSRGHMEASPDGPVMTGQDAHDDITGLVVRG